MPYLNDDDGDDNEYDDNDNEVIPDDNKVFSLVMNRHELS